DAFSFYNPVAVNEQNIQEGKKQEIIGSLKADLKPVDWLTVSTFYSISRGNDLKGFYTYKNSLFNATNGDKNKTHNGYARKETEDRYRQMFEITGLFEKDFVEKLNVKLLAGYSYQEETTDWYKAAGEGFLTDGFTYNNLGAASDIIANEHSADSYKKGNKLVGFFGRLNLNWDDGIFLAANFRRDGSTMFGENNKWGNFPGISAGVDITRWVEIPQVNRLKVRGGYGETGNLPKDPYFAQDLWNVAQGGNFFYEGEYIQSFEPVRNPNPDLKWEVKKELGFGIDFALLNYRLGGSIDYFKSNGTDLILEYDVPVAPPHFTDKKWMNVGELENSGLEFVINYKVLQSGEFKWTTDFNFTYYISTKMIDISNPYIEAGSDRFYGELGAPNLTGVRTILASDTVGKNDVGQIIAPIYMGVDSAGNKIYKDVNGDGVFNPEDDYEIVGSGLPDFTLGWGNTFTYKNFFLNFFLRGVFGHSLVNVNNARYGDPITIDMQSGMGITLDYIDTEDGIQYSDVHVEKADFVKLDNFAIGYNYNLPENKYVTSIKFYVSGQNLFTITGYSGVDPEVRYGDKNDNDNPLAPGIDRQTTYFSTRSFTAGINVLF
ncbi:MAG: TonB-dependent receptor, partial [Bacteroidales bacterium]|nr:TonB-dependent receptor [Bacteroidales bacterium]